MHEGSVQSGEPPTKVENGDLAKRYQRALRPPVLLSGILSFVASISAFWGAQKGWLGGVVPRWLMHVLHIQSASSPFLLAAYVVVLVVLFWMVVLVPRFWEYMVNRRFGVSRQAPKVWLIQVLVRIAWSTLLVLTGTEAVNIVYRMALPMPWLWLGAFWTLGLLAMAYFRPRLLVGSTKSLLDDPERVELARRLMSRSRGMGVSLQDVAVRATSKYTSRANAWMAGFGKRREVVFTDTVFEILNDEEVEAVFIHEIGHAIRHDVPRILAGRAMVICLAFAAAPWILLPQPGHSLPDVAAMASYMTGFAVVAFVARYFHQRWMQRYELAADAIVYETLGRIDVFHAALKKLEQQNLTCPGLMVARTHPQLGRRLEYGRKWQQAQSALVRNAAV